MGPTIAGLLGDELPTHAEWPVERSTSDDCVWRRSRPTSQPTDLYSIVLMRRDGWSVSFAYQMDSESSERRLAVDIESFETLNAALNEIEARFQRGS